MIRLLLILSLSSCAHLAVKEDFPLFDRILRPRGDQALTWRKCVEENWLGECQKYETESYDIMQGTVRETFSELGFVCKINGERYHICEYNGDIGFCKQTFDRKWFLGKKQRKVINFIGHSEIDKLKEGKTRCFSIRRYEFGSI